MGIIPTPDAMRAVFPAMLPFLPSLGKLASGTMDECEILMPRRPLS